MEEENSEIKEGTGGWGQVSLGEETPVQGDPAYLGSERGHQKVGHKKSREDFMMLS